MTSDATTAASHLAVRAVNGARRYRFDRDVFMTLMRVQRLRAFRRLRTGTRPQDTAARRNSDTLKGLP